MNTSVAAAIQTITHITHSTDIRRAVDVQQCVPNVRPTYPSESP